MQRLNRNYQLYEQYNKERYEIKWDMMPAKEPVVNPMEAKMDSKAPERILRLKVGMLFDNFYLDHEEEVELLAMLQATVTTWHNRRKDMLVEKINADEQNLKKHL